jgi:hypothetical protein
MKWTTEEEAILRENYNKLGAKAVYEMLPHRTYMSIIHKAKDLGLSYDDPNRWTELEENLLRERYGNEDIHCLLEQLPGRKIQMVCTKAARMGLNGVRAKRQARYISHRFFFREVSVLNSYWAGFLAADGNIYEPRNAVSLGLSAHDREHLNLFLEQVGYPAGIYQSSQIISGKKFDYLNIQIHCAEWVNDLQVNFNIPPRKSLTLQPPNGLNHEQSLAFIIGDLDGDGSIGFYRRQFYKDSVYSAEKISFSGTEALLCWIKDILDKVAPPKRNQAMVRKHHGIFQYQIQGTRARSILKILKSVDCPHLPRKWDKVREDGSVDPEM